MTESTQTQTTALCAASPDGYISAARDFSKTLDASVTAPTPELLQRACDQSVAGFERSYQVTFYAALVALFLGCLLPGWPQKWVGRRESGNVD
jgi:hypothetical protein